MYTKSKIKMERNVSSAEEALIHTSFLSLILRQLNYEEILLRNLVSIEMYP